MRLGQIARKYDLPVQSIIDFLEEETGEKIHPNTKIFEAMESRIAEQFGLNIEDEIEVIQDLTEQKVNNDQTENESIIVEGSETITDSEEPLATQPLSAAEEIALVEGEIEVGEPPVKTPKVQEEEKPLPPKEEEIIQSDKLIEMMESEEESADLEQIKLIKAPKKELPGLKVLGKVELPVEKPKKEKTKGDAQSHKNRRPQLSEEEKEKRRLAAKRKKEAAEARKDKQRKAQEAKQIKALKAKHYEQKLKKVEKQPVVRDSPKSDPKNNTNHTKPNKPRTEPKTLLGKWWRWMNT